jgi:tetratricopeptide (TPR) repeat protein
MQVLAQMKQDSQSFMQPLAQTLMYGGKEVAYLSYLQQFEKSWDLFETLKANTKPPFDQVLTMMEVSLHTMQDNDELAAAALAQFEKFLTEFNFPIYDQFIDSIKAVAARKAGDFKLAIELHDQAIHKSNQSILTLNTLHVVDEMTYQKAITLYESEQYEASIELLDGVLIRNPLFAQCLVVKAKNLIALGDSVAATEVIEQAQQIWHNADADFKDNNELTELIESIKTNDI